MKSCINLIKKYDVKREKADSIGGRENVLELQFLYERLTEEKTT